MTNDEFTYARERLGCTQSDIAICLGVSPTTIGHYERGRRPIPVYIALAMRALWHRLEEPL